MLIAENSGFSIHASSLLYKDFKDLLTSKSIILISRFLNQTEIYQY